MLTPHLSCPLLHEPEPPVLLSPPVPARVPPVAALAPPEAARVPPVAPPVVALAPPVPARVPPVAPVIPPVLARVPPVAPVIPPALLPLLPELPPSPELLAPASEAKLPPDGAPADPPPGFPLQALMQESHVTANNSLFMSRRFQSELSILTKMTKLEQVPSPSPAPDYVTHARSNDAQ